MWRRCSAKSRMILSLKKNGNWQLHSCSKGHSRRQQVDHGSKEFSERYSAFRDQPLRVVKVERVENPALKMMFSMKKGHMSLSTSQTMFQCISAQFCDMICKIGFHAECAPPEDTFYGEGIYFTNSIQEALDLWKSRMEEYVYFVEAQVLTGKPTKGKQGMILPPPVGTDSDKLYDSVYGGSGTAVIFSGYQALPKYIITCKRSGNFSSRF
ncbi:Poly [ADP-ribose] polymerase 9 [Oryzias melastigma]|uniref:Poly [ADP-ribose] polymerase n=1 Tax=Oryzias melastigma TaxID=30732 RepID=A0A834F399_ORYME|nr:Poly [ADP-ribose] polymerase 9 [Oryzias melastigma]